MQLGKVFISSGSAFLMAIAVALLIERLGGAVGSVIGTIPSTIIPASYIILTELSKTKEERASSMLACIYGIFSTLILFMPIWKVLPPKLPKKWSNKQRVWTTSVISLLIWFGGALITAYLQELINSLGINMWLFSIVLILIILAVGTYLCWSLPPTPAGKNKVSLCTHFTRGLAASVAIFAGGVLSQMDVGVLSGVVTTFPAIFLTTMVSVSISQGADVSTGAIGPMIMGGISYVI